MKAIYNLVIIYKNQNTQVLNFESCLDRDVKEMQLQKNIHLKVIPHDGELIEIKKYDEGY